jgi:cytochrome b
MSQEDMVMSTQVKWDMPTRLLHWIIAACMVIVLFSAIAFEGLEDLAGKRFLIKLKYYHLYAGIVLAVAVCVRLLWGFFGNGSVKWCGIPLGIAKYRKWAAAEIQFVLQGKDSEDRKKTGHNPLAIPVYIFALVMIVMQTLTGLAMQTHLDREARKYGVAVMSPSDVGQQAPDFVVPNVYADKHKEGKRHDGDRHEVDKRHYRDGREGEGEKEGEDILEELHGSGLFWVPLFLVLHLGGMFLHYLRGEKGLLSGMLSGR